MPTPADIYKLHNVKVPQRERTLIVDGLPADLPPAVWDTYLDKVALHVAVAAMNHGITRVEIRRPGRDPVRMDLDHVVKENATHLGRWPRSNAPWLAEYELFGLGARFEKTGPKVVVPAFPAEEPAQKGD